MRWRMANVIERFACHRDDVRLANFERVCSFDREWKLLPRPAEHNLSNFTTTLGQREFRR